MSENHWAVNVANTPEVRPAAAQGEANGFRQVMSILHTWSSLLPIWVLYFVFITGSVGYFRFEVNNWMTPEVVHVGGTVDDAITIEHAVKYLNQNAAGASKWTVSFPSGRKETAHMRWYRTLAPEELQTLTPDEQRALRESNQGSLDYDPISGVTYGDEVRDTGGGDRIYRMHYILHYLPLTLAKKLVIICTILMFVALISGIVIHKKIFRDFFTFRPAKGQRSWLDVHNIFSVMTLPFQLMITYSGMLFFVGSIMPLVAYGPAATLGFDVENALSAFSSPQTRLSPKNKKLYDLVVAETLGVSGSVSSQPTGVKTNMVPLPSLLSDFRNRYPGQRVSYLSLVHPNDESATVTIQSSLGLDGKPTAKETYSATTGELLSDPSREKLGSVSGDVRNVVLSLHEGRFSPIALRWLYFLSGLAGAAMIASGAVLWVSKRRQAYESKLKRFSKKTGDTKAANAAPELGNGVVFVERMNVATIIGLPIGVAGYFLANRLIPVAMENRASLEADAMFAAWALTFVIAAIRPRTRIWPELMWVACFSYAAIPLINAFTTDRHLGKSLWAGDWMMAGFDLTMFATAALFLLAARRSAAHQEDVQPEKRPANQQPILDPAE
ncbi:MAG: PepSY-associated TM helix domain-containing protein [Pseudomonadota bacterium]